MDIDRRPRFATLAVLKYAVLALGAVVMIAPFIDMVLGALRTPAERLAVPQVYWPGSPQWNNFARVFAELPMLTWLFNSVLITSVITALQLATSTMAGYALAKYRFRGSDLLLKTVIGAQMFPFFLLIIPIFFLLRFVPLAGSNDIVGSGGSGLLNSYLATILPFSISWYGIFLMRQFAMNDRTAAAPVEPRDTGDVRLHLSLERSHLDHDGHAQRARIADDPGRDLSVARGVRRSVFRVASACSSLCVDRPDHCRISRAAAILRSRHDCG